MDVQMENSVALIAIWKCGGNSFIITMDDNKTGAVAQWKSVGKLYKLSPSFFGGCGLGNRPPRQVKTMRYNT